MTRHVGERLSYEGHLCTVRYVGDVKGTKGEWLGVEWDDFERGKHAGEHNGMRYFECRSNAPTPASFVRPSRPHDKRKSFVEALKEKYAPSAVPKKANEIVNISGKDVDEVGMDKIREQQAQLKELRVIVLDGLCIGSQATGSSELDVVLDVGETCPKCTELDLSQNLFESWEEILAIVKQLPALTSLRVDGNRLFFAGLAHGSVPLNSFSNLKSLHFSSCLLTWSEMQTIIGCFPSITELSLDDNQLFEVTMQSWPEKLAMINLEANEFTSLDSIAGLTSLQSLQRINLKHNKISVSKSEGAKKGLAVRFPSTVVDVDLSFNNISDWDLVNTLVEVFPGVRSLRLSSNPLYGDLRAADGSKLNADDAFMLTLARLKRIETLNYSKITPKERLNAEAYYLSQIGKELSLSPDSAKASIIARHPRYAELCATYGEPAIERKVLDEIHPNSLAARLVRCRVRLGPSFETSSTELVKARATTAELEIPRSFTIYNVLSLVGKLFSLSPMSIDLVWETGEALLTKDDDSSDSEDGEDKGARQTSKPKPAALREEPLTPLTRRLGTWLEQPTANVRVELRKGAE